MTKKKVADLSRRKTGKEKQKSDKVLRYVLIIIGIALLLSGLFGLLAVK